LRLRWCCSCCFSMRCCCVGGFLLG